MKTFKQFNEESRQIAEAMGYNQNPLGPLTVAGNVIGGTLNLAKKGVNLAGRLFNSPPARAYYGYEAGKETMKSIKNKEPLHQTGFKAMQGYFAKKTGGLKRGLTGVLGQYLTPGDKSQ